MQKKAHISVLKADMPSRPKLYFSPPFGPGTIPRREMIPAEHAANYSESRGLREWRISGKLKNILELFKLPYNFQ